MNNSYISDIKNPLRKFLEDFYVYQKQIARPSPIDKADLFYNKKYE